MLFLAAFSYCSLTNAMEGPQAKAPELQEIAGTTTPAPAYRHEASSVLSAAKTASIFVAGLAIAGIGFTYFFRRRTDSTGPGSSIHILDKRVVSPGLLAVLIETNNQKILILQDKKSHSAIRLGNEEKY